MGEEILNESCSFVCSNAQIPSPFIKSMDPSSRATDGGKKILTANAKCIVSSPVPCLKQPIPNTPNFLPCSLSSTAPWCSTNGEMSSLGASTLTEKSYCMCIPFGGKITPQKATLQSTISKNGMSSGCFGGSGGEKLVDTAVAMLSSFVAQPERTTDIVDETENPSATEQKPLSDVETTSVEEHTPENISETERKYLLCDYRNCEKRDSCDYFHAKLDVHNDSVELRRNYSNGEVFGTEYARYLEKEEEGKGKIQENEFGNQAHHLISGNQCFMAKDGEEYRFGVLLRLANFFGYNVNESENCVILPSYSQETMGDSTNLQDSAFQVMQIMGAQWHSGGHAYQLDEVSLEKIEIFYEKHPEKYTNTGDSQLFSNYMQMVCKELDRLLQRKYSRKQCLLKDTQRKKELFVQEIQGISRKIKMYLDIFSKNPTDSYPFFVSAHAVSYAYNIPSVAKIMVIYSLNDKCLAKKCFFTRYKKNEQEVEVKFQEEHIVEHSVDFVRFCRNFVFFIMPEETILPFSYEVKKLPIAWGSFEVGGTITEKIEAQKKEIMTHIANYPQNLISEATLVSQRQKEYKEGGCCDI